MELLGKGAGTSHGTHIRGDHYHVLALLTELLGIVIHEHRVAQQIIHRDIEEALDLGGMEVHGEDPVSAGCGEHIGHQLGGDRITGLGLAVLTGIAEVGDHRGNAAGGSPLHGIDHDEQLHQVVVDRTAGGLYQEHIGTTDRFIDGGKHLAIGKMADLRVAQLDTNQLTNVFGQSHIGIAAEHLHILAVRNHFQLPLSSSL